MSDSLPIGLSPSTFHRLKRVGKELGYDVSPSPCGISDSGRVVLIFPVSALVPLLLVPGKTWDESLNLVMDTIEGKDDERRE